MNLSSPPYSQNPQRPPYKFLTRNLQTSIKPKVIFRNACIKRYFVKNFYQREEYNDGTQDFVCKLIKSKSCKILQSISLLSVSQRSLRNNLKLCKNLKKLHLATFEEEMKMKKVTLILKKLSSHLKMIYLKRVTPNPETDETFYKFAKTIFRFPKLEIFDRDFGSYGNFHSVQDFQKELKVYNKFASRLKQLKTVNFGFSLFEIYKFQGAMKEKFIYSGINGLIINLELDYLFDKIGNEVFGIKDDSLYSDIPYDLNDQEHIFQILLKDPNRREDQINQELMMKQRMNEEMKLFFPFEFFPNLKKLEINQDYMGFCTLTSFVGYGFKALKNLQELSIKFLTRSKINTMYFFKQLFQLPLLQKLSLSLPFLKDQEWIFLEQFLKGQEKLESLCLRVAEEPCRLPCYLEQSVCLENTIKSLSNKPLLKSLELKSPLWSLEAISKGLSWLKMENQLQTLKIGANDILATSDQKLVKRIEGLISFINNQKESLKTLEISIPFVLQSQIINPIVKIISSLNQLKELGIFVNYDRWHEMEYYAKRLRDSLEENMRQKKFTTSQTWASALAKNLLKIENLENFALGFEILNDSQEELLEGFLDIMNTLPRLNRLRKVKIASRSTEYLLPLQQQMVNSMIRWENIREIEFDFHFFGYGGLPSSFNDLEKAVKSLNKRQSIRSDLMF